jgi:hypothetical protein
MKKIFVRLLCFFTIPTCCIVGINFFIDPANIFKKSIYETIVNHLIEDKNVTNIPNLDERLLQKLYINLLNKCPDEIVLGSSRIMQIGNASNIQRTNLINNGVSGASLEDILSIYYLYVKKGCKIKKITLGLDPYFLNDNHGQNRWITLETEFIDCYNQLFEQKKGYRNPLFEDKYKELFSLAYFRSSLDYLKSGNNKQVHSTENHNNKKMTRLTDGTITYDYDTRNISIDKSDKSVKQAIINQPLYSMQGFLELSVYYKDLFSLFIEHVIQNNIEIEFVFIPLHPLLFNYLQNDPNYKMFFEAEKFYQEIASEKQIKIIGSFDPNSYNLEHLNFYDGFHCKEEVIELLFTDIIPM